MYIRDLGEYQFFYNSDPNPPDVRPVSALSFDDINGNLKRDPGERWFIGGGGQKDPPFIHTPDIGLVKTLLMNILSTLRAQMLRIQKFGSVIVVHYPIHLMILLVAMRKEKKVWSSQVFKI